MELLQLHRLSIKKVNVPILFHIDTKLHSPFIERVDVRNNYKPLLFVSDRSKNLDFEKLLMSTKIPRRISRSNISSDDVVKARWKARRTTVINSSIKLVRSNIPANRSRHSLQRSDKIAFYDSQGATSPFARFQRRKIHAYEIILSNINLASVVAKSTTRIVAPRKKKKKTMDKSICRGWCFSWIGERPWSIRFWELDWPARVCFPSCWKNKRGRVSPFSRPCESEGNLRSSWISIIY